MFCNRFGKYLLRQGVDISTIHLIGHSLGSHISAYMAKGLKTSNENGTMKVGRITGL
jgi:carboxypeptidase C (cathepsin A)